MLEKVRNTPEGHIRENVIQGILSFWGVYGIDYVLGLAGFRNSFFTVFSVMLMAAVWGLLCRTRQSLKKMADRKARGRRIFFGAAVSILFSVTTIMGYQLQSFGMTDGGFRGKGLIFLRALCLAIAVFPAANGIFEMLETAWAAEIRTVGKEPRLGLLFGGCTVVTFLCLIPVWLAYYPIIMSYDFHRQVNEAVKGFEWFYPYQPIAHTWIIWLFLQVGNLLGSAQTGMACMAFFQMLLYALVTSYAVVMVYRVWKRVLPTVLTLLYFAVFPFNTVLVVCTTKDVLFSILFLLFFLLFLERNFFSSGKKKIAISVALLLAGWLMVQFRNNAFYAVVVFAVLLVLFTPKKEKWEMLLLCALLVLGSKVTQYVILQAIGTKIQAPKIEMYSVPIQQMARVGNRQEDNLDLQTAELLDSYLKRDIWEAYNPPLADTVKGSGKVNADKLYDTGQFLQDWLKLGLKYPNEYLDAFLELTRGYWFWDDVSWAENLGFGVEGRMGAIFTYTSSEIEGAESIEHETKFPWLEKELEQIVSANAFYNWPVVSMLFRSAFYSWMLCLVMVAYWYLRQKKQFLLGLFPGIYFATMLLGPVVQLRYLFPVMCVLPIMWAFLWFPKTGK